jgi:hypothetical protein
MAGGNTVNRIARWNGSSWAPLGSGMNDYVLELEVYNNELIACGCFTNAGGNFANHIAKWNGSNWSPLGSGTISEAYGLTVYNNDLIVSGWFVSAGGIVVNHIASWNGNNWAPLGSGLNAYAEVVTVYGNEVVAGGGFTSAGGIPAYRVAKWNGNVGITKISKEIPNNFFLSQNYPNPFNPTTAIEFDIPKTAYTKLIVNDLLGREVETLVNEELKAGSYKVNFNGDRLSSGVYYYKLSSANFSETKKLVLIK